VNFNDDVEVHHIGTVEELRNEKMGGGSRSYTEVGWCILTASTPILKQPMVSALETTIS
jgi:hypothetical protein